ncbi:MAG: ABC transporter substrate-binding protein [Candidatus Rokubacteria bacterium]|nr:ABC transporter substrate-binding protein [Candidatus Rokubacteria bacterium]
MRGVLAVVATCVLVALAASARAGAPTDQLKSTTDRVLKLLQDPELKKPEKLRERRGQIRAIANEVFDWQETAKRALGRHWLPRTPQAREEFSQLFADLLERSYIGKIEAYTSERIIYAGEAIEGDLATVRTKLITKSDTEIPIDYRMLRAGDRWRAYDVVIEGVSLVANYRSQFNRIITQSGFEDLLKRLKTKQEELVFEEAERAKKKP